MAIQNTARTATYTSTGSTGPYTFTFAYNDDEDLKLTIDGVLSTAFAVTPGAGEGGTFYTNSITDAGAVLVFFRETPRTQGQTFASNTTPRAASVAAAVDKLTMVVQEQDAAIAATTGADGAAGADGADGAAGADGADGAAGSADAVEFVAQTLTPTEQAQARANIGAEILGGGAGSSAFAVEYAVQSLTGPEQVQARTNIAGASEVDVVAAKLAGDTGVTNAATAQAAADAADTIADAAVVTADAAAVTATTAKATADQAVSFASQSLSSAQQIQARANIGAEATGGGSANAVEYVAQTLTSGEQVIARDNIDAASSTEVITAQNAAVAAQATADDAVSYEVQVLTAAQQLQARTNIDALHLDDINPVSYDAQTKAIAAQDRARTNISAVGFDVINNMTSSQKAQARDNIEALGTVAQTLTLLERAQVNDNISAVSTQVQTLDALEIDTANANLESVAYAPQTLTTIQQTQARTNIGAGAASADAENFLEITRSTFIVDKAVAYGGEDPNGVYTWTPASNAFIKGNFKIFKNAVGTVTQWYMQLSGVAVAGRLDADLIGGFAITDSNFGTVMDVSYGTRTTVYSQSLVDITDKLNEAAYGDNFSFGRGVFTYSGLKHSSTSTITNGRNIAVAGSDAIGNHRELPGGLILRSNVYRAATIKLVQSGATARSGGTIFLALRLNGFSQVIDLVIDANAYDNISNNGVIREDLFDADGTIQMDSFDWLYTGSRGNPHGAAASRQGGSGTPNWELGPHYGCYTTRGDRSILKGCKFIGWTGGGCNIQTGGTNFTDEQYGNNIYGHYTLVDGCTYAEPVDVSWNTPYISVVNSRFGTTIKNTTVYLPDTEDDFWVLGGGAWASGQTFAFPNHDNTLFENNRAYNCGAMFHRDTLAINGSIMRGNSSYNCGYGVLIAMSDSDLCQNIVIEDNTFEVRNMNGTTRGTGVKITHAGNGPYTYGITLNNNTIIGVSDITRPSSPITNGEYGFQMGSTFDWGDIEGNFFLNTTFRHNVTGYWDSTDPSVRQVSGLLNNVIDDDANAPGWSPWDYDTDAGLATVEVSTVGVGSANILLSGESGLCVTNTGTTVKNYHVLPAAAPGLTFTFINDDTDGMYIGANTGDTIRLEAAVSAASGNIETTVIGSHITLLAIDTTQWIATSVDAVDWLMDGARTGDGSHGEYYFSTPATTTLAAATAAKAAGTTTAAHLHGFTATDNRLTYTGIADHDFLVTASMSLTKQGGGVGSTMGHIYIYKNGVGAAGLEIQQTLANTTDIVNLTIFGTLELTTNDYVEIWCETDDGDDLTVELGIVNITDEGPT